MTLPRRALGTTGLEVPVLGFGCSSFWAKTAFPERDAIGLVHRAIDLGIEVFDTGSSYAAGQAERRLGAALRSHPSRGRDLLISTKAGTLPRGFGRTGKDFSPSGIRSSVEQSLRRLGLETLPLLHLHVPRPHDLGDALLETLCRLRDEGKVRHLGVHGANPDLHPLVLRSEVFATAMYDWNLLCRERRERIAELVAAGKGFLGATPLAQALYSSRIFRPTRRADLWYLARDLGNHRPELRRGRAFRFVEHVAGWTGAQVALAWALSNPDVSVAIFGTTSPARLEENVAAATRALPQELRERIDSTPA